MNTTKSEQPMQEQQDEDAAVTVSEDLRHKSDRTAV